MRKILLVFTILFATKIFAGSGSDDNGWFKFMTGKLKGKNANLMLVRYDSSFSGYLIFEDSVQPQRIIGSLTNDSIIISPYTINSSFDELKGVFKKGTYKGTCTDADNSAKTDFNFKEDNSKSDLFDFEYIKGEKSLFKDFKKSPKATYTQGCIWPSEKYPDYLFIRKIISEQKKFPPNLQTVNSELKKNMKTYFSDYLKDFKDVTKAEIEKDEYAVSSYSEEEEDLLIPAYYDKNIFVLSQMEYSYTGGAHGNYGTSYTTIDLSKKRILNLNDIIFAEDTTKLTPLLEKYFRKQFRVSDTNTLIEAGLFIDTITANDNFCLTPSCLMFCYMPYEIGPWALGEVNIYIPISEIESFLKPDAKSLLR